MIFVKAFNKTRYNIVHKAINVKINNKVYLRLH